MTYATHLLPMVGKRLVRSLAKAGRAWPLIGAALLLWCAAGCASTYAPPPVRSAAPSYDGNEPNSGFIAFAADGSAWITAGARDRYNGLVKIYGRQFVPPLRRDAGVRPGETNGTYRIDAQHLARFATMSRWRKQGR